MWGPIIQAGASIISSLFGKKKSSNRINYKQMVADATAAGFNPLTALRNGGAAGYTSTSDATPFASRLAEGLSSAADTFFQNYNPMEDKTRELGYEIMQQQLANLQAAAPTPHKTKFGGVMVREAPPRQERLIGSGVKVGATKLLTDEQAVPQTPTVEAPTLTNPWPTSTGWKVNPDLPDAATYEQRYGEPGDWIGGVLTFGGDAAKWIYDWQQGLKRDTDERRRPGKGKPYNRPDQIYIPPALHRSPSW